MRLFPNPNFRAPLSLCCAFLLAWGFSFCGFMWPAHACCSSEAVVFQNEFPDQTCCQTQPLLDRQSILPGRDGGEVPEFISASQLLLEGFQRDWTVQAQSLWAQRYVPDQSGRHLELSVLLN